MARAAWLVSSALCRRRAGGIRRYDFLERDYRAHVA